MSILVVGRQLDIGFQIIRVDHLIRLFPLYPQINCIFDFGNRQLATNNGPYTGFWCL
jgi:hypothetical protein